VLDLLTSLVDKSLVVFEERKDEAVGRYRLLETIRQYALEKMDASGEESAVKDRHLNYLLEWAEHTEPKLHGPAQTFWLDNLELEHDNLRAALTWSLDGGSEDNLDDRLLAEPTTSHHQSHSRSVASGLPERSSGSGICAGIFARDAIGWTGSWS